MKEDKTKQALKVLANVTRTMNKLERHKVRTSERVIRAVKKCDENELAEATAEFQRVNRTIKCYEQVIGVKASAERVFVFSSLLLRDSFGLCCNVPDKEGMHFVVGIEHDDILIGTHIVPFRYSHRSIAGAGGVHADTHSIAIDTYEAKHLIVALMHSHPGCGETANFNSGTDMETQRQWESGWPMISGIWSRDGFLRFFSWQLPFGVEVVGNHIEQMEEENVFKLIP